MSRFAVLAVAAVLVTACGEEPRPQVDLAPLTPEQRAAWQRDRQAEAICAARGAMVGAQTSGRSVLDLDSTVAELHTRNVCIRAYNATGILPTY
jgi:hypothetical protein